MGAVSGLGALTLMVTAYMLFRTIEQAFNAIWRVTSRRRGLFGLCAQLIHSRIIDGTCTRLLRLVLFLAGALRLVGAAFFGRLLCCLFLLLANFFSGLELVFQIVGEDSAVRRIVGLEVRCAE